MSCNNSNILYNGNIYCKKFNRLCLLDEPDSKLCNEQYDVSDSENTDELESNIVEENIIDEISCEEEIEDYIEDNEDLINE